jgi:hypothetical protein
LYLHNGGKPGFHATQEGLMSKRYLGYLGFPGMLGFFGATPGSTAFSASSVI